MKLSKLYHRLCHTPEQQISRSPCRETTVSSALSSRLYTTTCNLVNHHISMSPTPSPNNSVCPTYLTPLQAPLALPPPPRTTSTPPFSPAPPWSVLTMISVVLSNASSHTPPCPSFLPTVCTSLFSSDIFPHHQHRSTAMYSVQPAPPSSSTVSPNSHQTAAPSSSSTQPRKAPPPSNPNT